jgi:hypothetical protein
MSRLYNHGFPIDGSEENDLVTFNQLSQNLSKFIAPVIDLVKGGIYSIGISGNYNGLTLKPRTLFIELLEKPSIAIQLGMVALEYEKSPGEWVEVGRKTLQGLSDKGDYVSELMGMSGAAKAVPTGKALRINVINPIKGISNTTLKAKVYLAGIYF